MSNEIVTGVNGPSNVEGIVASEKLAGERKQKKSRVSGTLRTVVTEPSRNAIVSAGVVAELFTVVERLSFMLALGCFVRNKRFKMSD